MNRSIKLAIAGIVVAAIAWLAFGFFGIQTAFIDDKVSEANPFAATASGPATQTPAAEVSNVQAAPAAMPETEAAEAAPASEVAAPAAPQIVTLASGSLVDHAHAGQGTINVLTDGNQRFLRFEDDFAIDNGPDLNVYLVRGADANGDPGLFDDDFIDLGDLKGNIGAQNYELSPDIDLDEYDTVVIWCVRFGVAFNAANIS